MSHTITEDQLRQLVQTTNGAIAYAIEQAIPPRKLQLPGGPPPGIVTWDEMVRANCVASSVLITTVLDLFGVKVIRNEDDPLTKTVIHAPKKSEI